MTQVCQSEKFFLQFHKFLGKIKIRFAVLELKLQNLNVTRVVPKPVLILSRRTWNAIYWNSDKAHVFCSTLPFQQAPTDICMSNRSPVTAGIVKTVVCIPSKRRKEKNEWKHKFIHSHHPHFPRLYIWHFLSQNAVHLQLNRPPFFMVVSNSPFGMCLKIVWVSWITSVSFLKFRPRSSHFNNRKNQNLESLVQKRNRFHFWFF